MTTDTGPTHPRQDDPGGPVLLARYQAVRAARHLAHHDETHQDTLAQALSELAVALGHHRRYEPALVAIAEATGIYRDLAEAHPHAWRPAWIGAGLVWAQLLGAAGRHLEAAELGYLVLLLADQARLDQVSTQAAAVITAAYQRAPAQLIQAWEQWAQGHPPPWHEGA